MPRFIIFGSVAWDRPVWLDRPLEQGGRILGLVSQDSNSELPGGRLGGGGANAAACLANAGHDVAVWSTLRDDPQGQQIRKHLSALGVNCAFLHPTEWIGGETLVLIEPNGERTILFQHSDPDLDLSLRRLLKRQDAKVDLAAVQSFNPDGIYIRSMYPGFESLGELEETCVVSHWPQLTGEGVLPADVLIGSKEDLIADSSLEGVFERGREACGRRLKWVIVTEGKTGGEIISATGRTVFSSPAIQQVDATGAGDAFAAGVLEALVAGGDIFEAARHGAIWGSRTASLKGSAEQRPPQTYPSWGRA
ncbi:PfkB family carbohydrate kinase [Hyphomonas atlantica corrig.]|uniref:PfkB family carbohydrate kinase n=1 Tax=Hyphomonas atlantica TaxID=1280948 RepID=UPI002357A2D5|nr:PfkB family carbohydrate kinase [Hyphomonas atlantica]